MRVFRRFGVHGDTIEIMEYFYVRVRLFRKWWLFKRPRARSIFAILGDFLGHFLSCFLIFALDFLKSNLNLHFTQDTIAIGFYDQILLISTLLSWPHPPLTKTHQTLTKPKNQTPSTTILLFYTLLVNLTKPLFTQNTMANEILVLLFQPLKKGHSLTHSPNQYLAHF